MAEAQPIQVGDDDGNECREALLYRGQVAIASNAVPRIDWRELRQRNQDLTNSLDDLLLVGCGEPGKAERLVLHFELPRAAPVEFVVRLDRNRRH
jgi:hypothetical protein